jgi:hypothetical protein
VAFSQIIARLGVQLGLDTASFQTGSRKAQQEVKGLRNNMVTAAKAIGGALAGMVAWDTVQQLRDMTRAAVDTVGALGEQAQQLGVTTDALQEYRYAASQTGIEQAQMDQALAQLTRRLGDAAQGAKEPTKALEQLGITLDQIKGRSAGDVIPLIAEGMKRLPDDAQRAAVAVDLFGKAGQKLMPLLSEGAQGIKALTDAAREMGLVLTPEEIANADKYADMMAALDKKVDAQLAAKLARNAEALYQFELAMADAKVALADFLPKLWTEKDTQQFKAIIEWFRQVDDTTKAWGATVRNTASAISTSIGNMVAAIRQTLGGTLDAMWNHVLGKIETVRRAFYNLYDAVVGHSYIPDMVDGIAAHMARLDAVMVNPATKATKAAGKEFQALRDLLDRLFPEVGRTQGFNADLARIQGSALNDNEKNEAVRRLWNDFVSGSPHGGGGMGGPDFSGVGPLVEGIGDTEAAIERLTEKSKINTVRIAKSFKDMADETLQSLGRLTNAVKSGGFFGILEAVVGFGLQLGSAGVFGKSIAANINRVPGHANGTMSAGRGLALVGERGPELVAFRGGERVYNNRESRGMMGGNTYHIQGNLLTPEFWAQIQAGDVAAAQAGAQGGVALGQYRQSRRWR